MTRTTWASAVVASSAIMALAAGPGLRGAPQAQATPAGSNPTRLAQMQHHFSQVSLIHESIIRGDLKSVHAPAVELSLLPSPGGIPSTAEPFVAAIRQAARRAAGATTLASAAAATVQMLTQCSDCHRAVGVGVTPSVPQRPDVGGLVGHMLEHQRAADDMLLGLLIPSPSQWRQGADRLKGAALKSDDLPVDPALTRQVEKADVRVHAIAKRAADAGDAGARANLYAELITTCAECHVAHSRVWGPGTASR